jgi:sugar phosphate isomerase/epimerase
MKRRQFIKTSAVSAAGMLLAGQTFSSSKMDPLKKIGLQLFTVPKLLEKDFEGTLKKLSEMGFKELEFYGPFPFSATEAIDRWKSVTPSLGFSGSGYFGKTAKETKAILDRYGLSSPSMHADLTTLKTKMGEVAEAAHLLGQEYVIIPSSPTRTSLDDYKKDADEFNEVGASAQKNGLKFGYHNHGNGLHAMNGTVPMNMIIEKTDPKLVFFEMDIYWTTAGGIDPASYFEKYPGRYRLMHIKDMKEQKRFSGDGGDSKQWIELFPYMTEPGSGVLDIQKIISVGKKNGLEHFILEQDMVANPETSLPKSYKYLSGLNF